MSEVHSFFNMESCMARIIGGNETNMVAASLCAWKESGGIGMWGSTFVFGFIPILLMLMIYVRTQKAGPTAFGGLMGMLLVNGVELYYFGNFGTLVYPLMSSMAYLVLVMLLGLAFLTHAKD